MIAILPPRAADPHIPGDVPRRAAHAAIAFERVEAIIERIVDLGS
jgi:hypothetical protein